MISIATPYSRRRRTRQERLAASMPKPPAPTKIRIIAPGLDCSEAKILALVSRSEPGRPRLLAVCYEHDLEDLAGLLIDAAPAELVAIEFEGADTRRGR